MVEPIVHQGFQLIYLCLHLRAPMYILVKYMAAVKALKGVVILNDRQMQHRKNRLLFCGHQLSIRRFNLLPVWLPVWFEAAVQPTTSGNSVCLTVIGNHRSVSAKASSWVELHHHRQTT